MSFFHLNLLNAGMHFLIICQRLMNLRRCIQLKKICQNNPSFTARSNYTVSTEKQRAQRPIQVFNIALLNRIIAHR
jgi:hypothetical protein